MRQLNAGLVEHIGCEATTLCNCWIIRRLDGVVMGFTDHDRDLSVSGIMCIASSGFQPTEAVTDLGLSTDNQEIEGAISDDSITVKDLTAGRFDGAKVEIWTVNWQNPDQCHHMRTAILGEVNREDHLFKAELRGMTSLLDQRQGRTFLRSCDTQLGGHICGVNLDQPAFQTTGAVTAINHRTLFYCSGIDAFEEGWFAYGNLLWLEGDNSGLSVEIANSSKTGGGQLTLWKAMPFAPKVGDRFTLTAGCDKNYLTCKAKFANGVNFRGFPHMPGSDFVLGYATTGDQHDGSALVK